MLLLFLVGFFLRLRGISDNHSFWADEAFISSIARDIIQGDRTWWQGIGKSSIHYQPLQIISTIISFTLFGVSEWSARLPSVVMGSIGIMFSYLLAKKLSNEYGGLLAAFIHTFSQLNLANATQAKPYAALQTCILIELYLISLLEDSEEKNATKLHLLIITIIIVSTLFHLIGILSVIPYSIYLATKYYQKGLFLLRKPHVAIIFLVTSIFIIGIMLSNNLLSWFFTPQSGNFLFTHNNSTYLRDLLWRNYGFITLPALFGFAVSWQKYRYSILSAVAWIAVLLYFWTFRYSYHNVRYIMPMFGILFVFFGVFWSHVGEKLLHHKSAIVCLAVAMLLYAGGYKLVRKPNVYYSPNADVLADVQHADYKTVYDELLKKYPDTNSYVIFNDVIDSQLWYLNGRAPDATFIKAYVNGLQDGDISTQQVTGKPIYTTLEQFKEQVEQNPKGILIVEDWQSILPEDIKKYAKSNLQLEIRVEGLLQANGDNWPVEIYSWGMNK